MMCLSMRLGGDRLCCRSHGGTLRGPICIRLLPGEGGGGVSVHFGDEPVAADDDVSGAVCEVAFEKGRLRDDGDFDADLAEFFLVDGVEPRIIDRGIHCCFFDRFA